jgi:hypothetical protein
MDQHIINHSSLWFDRSLPVYLNLWHVHAGVRISDREPNTERDGTWVSCPCQQLKDIGGFTTSRVLLCEMQGAGTTNDSCCKALSPQVERDPL